MHHWTYFGRNRKFWSDLYPLDQARTSNDPILNQLALAKDRIYPRIWIWHSSACPLTFWHIHNEKNWKILFFKNSWKNEISALAVVLLQGNPTQKWKSKGRPLQKISNFDFSFLLKIWVLQGMQCTIDHSSVKIESLQVICILFDQGPQMIQFWPWSSGNTGFTQEYEFNTLLSIPWPFGTFRMTKIEKFYF